MTDHDNGNDKKPKFEQPGPAPFYTLNCKHGMLWCAVCSGTARAVKPSPNRQPVGKSRKESKAVTYQTREWDAHVGDGREPYTGPAKRGYDSRNGKVKHLVRYGRPVKPAKD